jgi:hypothetical protein
MLVMIPAWLESILRAPTEHGLYHAGQVVLGPPVNIAAGRSLEGDDSRGRRQNLWSG